MHFNLTTNALTLLAVLFFCNACSSPTTAVEKETSLTFLSKEAGQSAILDETYEPYFSQLQIREIEAFTHSSCPSQQLDSARAYARVKFATAVVDFNQNEKDCINFVTEKVDSILQEQGLTLIAKQSWKFIKIESWLCGGFAHTRGDYIIISQKHIDHLSKGWKSNMNQKEKLDLLKRFGALLVHEKLHTLQRRYKSIFDKFYKHQWNFVQAQVLHETSISKHQVSNPDAPLPEWLIQSPDDNNTYFWVRTLLKTTDDIPVMGKDFMDLAFLVREEAQGFVVQTNTDKSPSFIPVDQLDFYKNAFPVTRGIDHPNEISAYMFSEYFVALLEEQPPFIDAPESSIKNIKTFLDWLQSAFK